MKPNYVLIALSVIIIVVSGSNVARAQSGTYTFDVGDVAVERVDGGAAVTTVAGVELTVTTAYVYGDDHYPEHNQGFYAGADLYATGLVTSMTFEFDHLVNIDSIYLRNRSCCFTRQYIITPDSGPSVTWTSGPGSIRQSLGFESIRSFSIRTASGGMFLIVDEVVFEIAPPPVEITTSEVNPTNESAIPVSFEFYAPVSGFDSSDIVITNGVVQTMNTDDGRVYDAIIQPQSDGAVEISVPADVATETEFNLKGNAASDVLELTSDRTPPDMSGSITIPENSPGGASAGTVSVVDAHDVSFTLTDDGNGRFQINPSSGTVSVVGGASLDHETEPSVTIEVEGTDEAGNVSTESLTVSVTDVNEAPVITSGAAVTSAENQTGVTTVSATDPDVGDQLSYAITGGADQALFSINPASGIITFAAPPDFESPSDFDADNTYDVTVTVTDNGEGTLSYSQALMVSVTDVNEAPFVNSPIDDFTVEEDAPDTVIDLTGVFSDPEDDSGALTFSVTSNSNAQLLSATIDNNTDALTLNYHSHANGTATVQIMATDTGTPGLTVTDEFDITVTPVNDAPVIENGFDGTPTVLEDGELTLVGEILVADVDADGADMVLLVEATSIFTANSSSTATITKNGTGNVTIVGSAAEINTALTGAVYTPDKDQTSGASLTFTVDDRANTGEGGAQTDTEAVTITITPVNDEPDFAASDPPAVDEDASTQSISGWVHSFDPGPDNESAQGVQSYNLSNVTNAALFASGPSVDSNGTLTYTPATDAYGTSDFTVNVTDDGGTINGGVDTSPAQTFTITVSAVNDAPVFSVGNVTPTIIEGGTQVFTGLDYIAISDVDADDADLVMTVTATSAFTANASGTAEIENNGTSQVTITGTVTEINDALDGAVYTPTEHQTSGASVTFSVNDGGNSGQGGAKTTEQIITFTIESVNDDPTISGLPSDITVHEDTPREVDLSSVTISDVDAGGNDITVTIAATAGTLAASSGDGVTVGGSGTSELMLTGTIADINTYLDTSSNVTYTGAANAHGQDEALLSVTANDGGHTGSGGGNDVALGTVNIDIDPMADTPSVTDATTDEDVQTTSGLVISRNAADGAEVTHFKITGITGGTLFKNDGTTQITNGDFITVAEGAAGLKFTPTPNSTTDGIFDVQASLSDSDGGLGGAAATATITVAAVNDAPTISSITDQTVPEDTATDALAFTVADIDTPVGTLVVSATSSDQALIPDANLELGGADGDRTITVTPAANANGTATITVTVSDGDLTADTTFEVDVTPVNDAPTISAIADQNVPEDTATDALAFTVADVDTPVGTLVVTASSSDQALIPDANLVLGGADGARTITVTPAVNANGTATITVTVSDGDLTTESTFDVTVASVNNAPSFTAGADVTVDEDAGAQNIPTWATNIGAGPPNEAGQNVTFQVTNSNASLFAVEPAIDATNGELLFTPAENAFGEATITVVLKDDGGTANGGADTSPAQTFSITVTPVNDAPVAVDDVAETPESSSVVIAVLANDVDVDSEFTLAEIGEPGHGQVALNDDGTVTYSPDAGYFGEDTFTYSISDGELSASATVTVTIQSTNDAPTPAVDVVTVFQGESASFNVLANDSDPDGDAIEARSLSAASLGSATLAANGQFTYTAHATAEGTDVLTYEAVDPEGQSTAATITVTVSGPGTDGDGIDEDVEAGAPNDGDGNDDGVPDAEQQNVASLPIVAGQNAGQYVTVAAPSGTSLDRVASTHNPAPESFPDDVEIPAGFLDFTVQDMDVGHSTVVEITLPPDAIVVGYLKYGPTLDNPEPHWYDFNYDGETGAIIEPGRILLHLTDGLRGDDDLTANGIIRDPGTPVFKSSQLPVPMPDVADLDEDTTILVDVLANDSDPEGAPLTVTAASAPTNGVAALENGRIRYTPNPDFFGDDAFVYTVTDGVTTGVQATVTVTVTGTQDAPVAEDDAAETLENTPVTIDIFANDFDVDGDALFLTSQDLPQNGRAVYNDDGTVTYTPNPLFYGTDTWTYTISDGPQNSAEHVAATITVTVEGVQEAPVGVEDAMTTPEDTPVLLDVLANDSDPDGDLMSIVSVTQPSEGAVEIVPGTGSDPDRIHFTPENDYVGDVAFSYTLTDGTDETGPVPVTVTVTPVNDAPVFADGLAIDLPSDEPVVLEAGAMFALAFDPATDVDGDTLSYRWEVSSTAGFADIVFTSVATDSVASDDVIAALALEAGGNIAVHHRIVATDPAGAETPSDGQSVTFLRASSVHAQRSVELPTEVYLSGNYPNPFNPSTTVEYGLPQPMHVSIAIHDMTGRQVRVLVDGMHDAGTYRHRLVLGDLPSGAYIYRMETPYARITKVMHLVK